ncbi:MAG TPA: S9 family peptidase [Bryobacteraceae bacterium]|nr:S9 family peptidase [Bryobacteraceae bacterium]
MNRIFPICLLSAGALCVMASGPDDRGVTDPKALVSRVNPGSAPIGIEELFFTRVVSNPAWSPDGREVVFTTNLAGRLNLWKVSAAGGWPVQLSQSEDRELGPAWSPDGKWIVYQQDFGGGEYYDLFALPASGGAAVNLTNTKDVSETGAIWSADGSRIALARKVKNSPASNVAVMDWASRAVRELTHELTKDHTWSIEAWSRDGKSLLVTRSVVGGTDSSVYLVDTASGQATELTPHSGRTVYRGRDLSPDGKWALVESNEKYGVGNVALVEVASKKLQWITDGKWDATPGEFSPSGDRLTYSVNEDGRTVLYLQALGAATAVKIDFPEGVSAFAGRPSAFSPSGDRLLVSHQSSQRPADLWVYEAGSRKSRQLTYSALASLSPERIPPSQPVHYRSFDGKVISAFAWVPDNLKRDGSNPAIVLPHGGPTGQTVDSFNRTVAALVTRGYVCIAPNVRGSTGYGMDFQQANHMDLGGGDLQDEVYATKFLIASGFVNAKKLGITGGSYGGYMTLMAIGKTPEVWAAAVEQYGIINWFTMLQHEDATLQAYQRSLIGDPVTDKKVYEDDSPITFIRNAKAPLLVLQGENDIRVPKEEAEQIAAILEKEGKVVAAHYYPAEGHGFAKRENQIDAIQRTVEWFDTYLKGGQ